MSSLAMSLVAPGAAEIWTRQAMPRPRFLRMERVTGLTDRHHMVVYV